MLECLQEAKEPQRSQSKIILVVGEGDPNGYGKGCAGLPAEIQFLMNYSQQVRLTGYRL